MLPHEIIAAPVTCWLAPVGESMPNVDDEPTGNWVKVGTSGDRNIHEDGVTVQHGQEIELLRTLGSTGPVKAFRTEESLMLSFVLLDLTIEQYKHVLNLNALVTVAAGSGTPGTKHVELHRGSEVQQRAMLLRGAMSPYGDGWALQYEVPRVVHVGEPEVVFKKGEPAGLLFEFQAIEDPDFAYGKFGRLVTQHQTAT